MKKTTLLLILLTLASLHSAVAQEVQLTATYGTQFGSKLKYGNNNYIKIEQSGQLGISLGVMVQPDVVAELSYYNHVTELDIKDFQFTDSNVEKLSDLTMNWFFLGASKYFGSNENVKPFFGGGLGLVVANPHNENKEIISYNMSNETRFSFYMKAGANFMISKVVGINIQGDLFIPVEYGGFYVGGGTGGFSTGVSTQSTIVLAGVSAGLVFNLGA